VIRLTLNVAKKKFMSDKKFSLKRNKEDEKKKVTEK
jgi:hypothetical protein